MRNEKQSEESVETEHLLSQLVKQEGRSLFVKSTVPNYEIRFQNPIVFRSFR